MVNGLRETGVFPVVPGVRFQLALLLVPADPPLAAGPLSFCFVTSRCDDSTELPDGKLSDPKIKWPRDSHVVLPAIDHLLTVGILVFVLVGAHVEFALGDQFELVAGDPRGDHVGCRADERCKVNPRHAADDDRGLLFVQLGHASLHVIGEDQPGRLTRLKGLDHAEREDGMLQVVGARWIAAPRQANSTAVFSGNVMSPRPLTPLNRPLPPFLRFSVGLSRQASIRRRFRPPLRRRMSSVSVAILSIVEASPSTASTGQKKSSSASSPFGCRTKTCCPWPEVATSTTSFLPTSFNKALSWSVMFVAVARSAPGATPLQHDNLVEPEPIELGGQPAGVIFGLPKCNEFTLVVLAHTHNQRHALSAPEALGPRALRLDRQPPTGLESAFLFGKASPSSNSGKGSGTREPDKSIVTVHDTAETEGRTD